MSTPHEWRRAYARQAGADFATWQVLEAGGIAPACHKLLFLQMACEKLCKAHLSDTGTDPRHLQTSHAYTAKNLPTIVRQQIVFSGMNLKSTAWVVEHTRHLAREIELLAPAVKRGDLRPDNCEYPWEDETGLLRIPLDWTFAPSRLLTEKAGRTFLKLVRDAIDRLRA